MKVKTFSFFTLFILFVFVALVGSNNYQNQQLSTKHPLPAVQYKAQADLSTPENLWTEIDNFVQNEYKGLLPNEELTINGNKFSIYELFFHWQFNDQPTSWDKLTKEVKDEVKFLSDNQINFDLFKQSLLDAKINKDLDTFWKAIREDPTLQSHPVWEIKLKVGAFNYQVKNFLEQKDQVADWRNLNLSPRQELETLFRQGITVNQFKNFLKVSQKRFDALFKEAKKLPTSYTFDFLTIDEKDYSLKNLRKIEKIDNWNDLSELAKKEFWTIFKNVDIDAKKLGQSVKENQTRLEQLWNFLTGNVKNAGFLRRYREVFRFKTESKPEEFTLRTIIVGKTKYTLHFLWKEAIIDNKWDGAWTALSDEGKFELWNLSRIGTNDKKSFDYKSFEKYDEYKKKYKAVLTVVKSLEYVLAKSTKFWQDITGLKKLETIKIYFPGIKWIWIANQTYQVDAILKWLNNYSFIDKKEKKKKWKEFRNFDVFDDHPNLLFLQIQTLVNNRITAKQLKDKLELLRPKLLRAFSSQVKKFFNTPKRDLFRFNWLLIDDKFYPVDKLWDFKKNLSYSLTSDKALNFQFLSLLFAFVNEFEKQKDSQEDFTSVLADLDLFNQQIFAKNQELINTFWNGEGKVQSILKRFSQQLSSVHRLFNLNELSLEALYIQRNEKSWNNLIPSAQVGLRLLFNRQLNELANELNFSQRALLLAKQQLLLPIDDPLASKPLPLQAVENFLDSSTVKLQFLKDVQKHLYLSQRWNNFNQQLNAIDKPVNRYNLPEVEIDGQKYTVNSLLWQKDITDFSRLLPVTKNQFVAIVRDAVPFAKLFEAVSKANDKYYADLNAFWDKLKKVLKKFPALPLDEIEIADQSYSLTVLFELKDKDYDVITITKNPVRQNDLLLLFINKVDLSLIEDLLDQAYAKTYWDDLRTTFAKFNFLLLETITINNQSYSLGDLFANKGQPFAQLGENTRKSLIDNFIGKITPLQIETVFKEKINQFWLSLKTILTKFLVLPVDPIVIDNQSYLLSLLLAVKDSEIDGFVLEEPAKSVLWQLLQNKVTSVKIKNQLDIAYWEELQRVFADFTFLPTPSIAVNKQQHLLSGLFAIKNKQFSAFSNDDLQTFTTFVESTPHLPSALAIKTTLNNLVDRFWLDLKTILNEFDALPAQSVTLKNTVFDLSSLFANSQTETAGSQLSGPARNELLKMMDKKIDLFQLGTILVLKQYSGLHFGRLSIKDNLYFTESLFFTDPPSQLSWEEKVDQSQELFTAFALKQLTIADFRDALNQKNAASAKLFASINQLIPYLASTSDLTTTFFYSQNGRQNLKFEITKLVKEFQSVDNISWAQVVADSRLLPPDSQFGEIIFIISSVVNQQSSDRFLQLLLWNPLQRWLNAKQVLSSLEKIVLDQKNYDFTALAQAKAETDWNNLNAQNKAFLQTLITNQIDPLKIKNALQVEQTTKPINNNKQPPKTPPSQKQTPSKTEDKKVQISKKTGLIIGLATAGGAVGLLSVGGLVYWLVKLRK